MKTFSRPLTTEEETYYIGLMRSSDQIRKKEATDVLIVRNMRLVPHITKKYVSNQEEAEEMMSVGFLGLIKGVKTFDPAKGCRLATYVSKCIENEVLMMLRARRKTSREVSLYEPIGTDREGNEVKLFDVLEYEQADVTEQLQLYADIQLLRHMIGTVLDQRELEIIALRYGLQTGEELAQREIGQRLGISRSYVSRIEKRALQKLKTEFQHRQIGEGYDFCKNRRIKGGNEAGKADLQP